MRSPDLALAPAASRCAGPRHQVDRRGLRGSTRRSPGRRRRGGGTPRARPRRARSMARPLQARPRPPDRRGAEARAQHRVQRSARGGGARCRGLRVARERRLALLGQAQAAVQRCPAAGPGWRGRWGRRRGRWRRRGRGRASSATPASRQASASARCAWYSSQFAVTKPAVLVAVRVAEHDLLRAVPRPRGARRRRAARTARASGRRSGAGRRWSRRAGPPGGRSARGGPRAGLEEARPAFAKRSGARTSLTPAVMDTMKTSRASGPSSSCSRRDGGEDGQHLGGRRRVAAVARSSGRRAGSPARGRGARRAPARPAPGSPTRRRAAPAARRARCGMHVAVLAQVEPGQVEAEDLDPRACRSRSAPVGQAARPARAQAAARATASVGQQLLRRAVGGARSSRPRRLGRGPSPHTARPSARPRSRTRAAGAAAPR